MSRARLIILQLLCFAAIAALLCNNVAAAPEQIHTAFAGVDGISIMCMVKFLFQSS